MKYTNDHAFQKLISSQIGKVGSTHCTLKQMQIILRDYLKGSKNVPKEREENYYLCLLDTLIDSISGSSIPSIYFFTGNDQSFIRLKTPLKLQRAGICWTGNIRVERGNHLRKQCLFSFLNTKTKDIRGIELYLNSDKLEYILLKNQKEDQVIKISTIEIREDVWHHITMSHIDKEFILQVDDIQQFTMEIPNQSFEKEYNIAIIGASIDPNTKIYDHFFFGAMSALYFFQPTSKFKEAFNDLHKECQYLPLLYKEILNKEEKLVLFPENKQKTLKFVTKEFAATVLMILDPQVNIFNKLPIVQFV